MKYICTNCNYIFDEHYGREEDAIEKVTSDTICPSCNEVDTFQGVEEEVNYSKDNDNPELLELEHIPQIEKMDKEGNKIRVMVGKIEHPMGIENKILSISLCDEYGDLILEELLFEDSEPIAEFDVTDFDIYEIRVKCSVHGIWGKRVEK